MILEDVGREEIISAVVTNYFQTWGEIVSSFGYQSPQDLFGLQGFISGIKYMMMNSIFDGDPRLTHSDVQDILEYFKNHQLPMMWFLSPKGRKLAQILRDVGLEEASMQVLGMVLDLKSINHKKMAEKTTSYDIRPASTVDADVFADIFLESFEVRSFLRKDMRIFAKNFLAHPHSTNFIGYLDEKPVTTVSVVYDAGVAGVYNVATLPEARGKGFAHAAMAKVIEDILANGYQYSILHATPMGKGVYTKLGYQEYFSFQRFLLRPQAVGL